MPCSTKPGESTGVGRCHEHRRDSFTPFWQSLLVDLACSLGLSEILQNQTSDKVRPVFTPYFSPHSSVKIEPNASA
jgi:hypothetical protein